MERLARLERLGWLSAGLIHDLNNTLLCVIAETSEIRAQLEVLRTQVPAPTDQIEECERSLDNMRVALESAVNHGRHLQRLYGGESIPPTLWRVDLRDAASRAIAIAPARLRPLVELSGDPVEVGIDRETIVRVLLNLLINAGAAIPPGTERARIRVRIQARDRWGLCDVTDNGSGVAPEILPRLFEPFATTKPEGTGTGLGLAVSRHLLRAAGADLLLAETGPGGTTFRLVLPLADPPAG
jgi:signal transduction histidine kinase